MVGRAEAKEIFNFSWRLRVGSVGSGEGVGRGSGSAAAIMDSSFSRFEGSSSLENIVKALCKAACQPEDT